MRWLSTLIFEMSFFHGYKIIFWRGIFNIGQVNEYMVIAIKEVDVEASVRDAAKKLCDS